MQSESALVAAAQRGDHSAFDELAAAHRDRMRLHCYRMLGSIHDADDAVQETLLKAWQNITTFEERSAFATWLHRIATNTCLNLIRQRPRVVVPDAFTSRHRPPAADVPWLEPYPDVDLPAPSSEEPEARIEAAEATRLAFIATMQLLPARQRAVLLLRDVLAWSAAEVADALDTTVPAVNSALQRARARLAEHRTWDEHAPEIEATVDKFIRMWEARNIDGIVRLLADDAALAMPPTPAWFLGPAEIGEFFATVPADGHFDQIRLLRVGANRQPAVAAYWPSPEDGNVGYGLMVFDLDGDRIKQITGFSDARLIGVFGLPETIGDRGR